MTSSIIANWTSSFPILIVSGYFISVFVKTFPANSEDPDQALRSNVVLHYCLQKSLSMNGLNHHEHFTSFIYPSFFHEEHCTIYFREC